MRKSIPVADSLLEMIVVQLPSKKFNLTEQNVFTIVQLKTST